MYTWRKDSSGDPATMVRETARKHFGDGCKVKTLTVKKVDAYFASERVMKTRAGADKNPVTIAKIRRVFRQMLVWAADKGVLEDAPLPEPAK